MGRVSCAQGRGCFTSRRALEKDAKITSIEELLLLLAGQAVATGVGQALVRPLDALRVVPLERGQHVVVEVVRVRIRMVLREPGVRARHHAREVHGVARGLVAHRIIHCCHLLQEPMEPRATHKGGLVEALDALARQQAKPLLGRRTLAHVKKPACP